MNKVIKRWVDDYSVVLHGNYTRPMGTPNVLPNILEFMLVSDIYFWCKDNNIKYKTIMRLSYDNPEMSYPTVTFNTIEDAMAFKLMWG